MVTHRRPDELAKSLDVLSTQTRLPDHLIVVDNDGSDEPGPRSGCRANQFRQRTWVRAETSVAQAVSRSVCCTRWRRAPTGCGWPTTTDARRTPGCWRPCWPAPRSTAWPKYRRWCATWTTRSGWRFRCGAAWYGAGAQANCAPRTGQDLLRGIASLFNGALFRASTLEAIGVPDMRLFIRGDEVELHRRLVRSGLPFGTCLEAVYLHPCGSDEFRPILGGRMHTQYPDDPTKRFFTYRNRGYLLSQPGLRKLLAQEWLRFGWFFLVSRRDPKGLLEWIRLRRLGRREQFGKPDIGGSS